jgi:Zn finger protein HypA/HybF involved in hydrogenase expression
MRLTLTEFAVLAVCVPMILVFVATIISRTSRVRAETRAVARRVICRLCLHAFETTHSDVVECPRCGAANERK